MTGEQLKKVYERTPFQPIELLLADGRVLKVPHRDFLYVPPKAERTFVVSDEDGVMETVDLLLVASIRPTTGKPGKGKRAA
jgi:hypothetical protein